MRETELALWKAINFERTEWMRGRGRRGEGDERRTIDRYGSFARFPVIARKTEY